MILARPQMRLYQADLLDFQMRDRSLAMQPSIRAYPKRGLAPIPTTLHKGENACREVPVPFSDRLYVIRSLLGQDA